jgi:hypothetical protein
MIYGDVDDLPLVFMIVRQLSSEPFSPYCSNIIYQFLIDLLAVITVSMITSVSFEALRDVLAQTRF